MKITETPLKDCYTLEVTSFGDQRGFFMEAFNQDRLNNELGIQFDIKQVNFAGSAKNVLRGLHYQDAPYSQTKLVGVTRGAVSDMVVDLRKNSPTYLKSYKATLNEPGKLLLVPRGFAHGYHALADDTLFYYFVDAVYSPEHEKGLLYNDKDLNLDWGFQSDPIVSQKDLNQPSLAEVENNF